MTRKKRGAGIAGEHWILATRSAKEKGNQVAVAAKLERFAHTPGKSPNKGPPQSGVKAQPGPSQDRKSQGQGQKVTVLTGTKMAGSRGAESESLPLPVEPTPHTLSASQEESEPMLWDILNGGKCKCSLNSLSEQIGGIKEKLLVMGQDLKKVGERTSALEERLSLTEDDFFPLKQEIKAMKELMALQASTKDEFENRAHRSNVRVVGLPEMAEGPQPAEFLEKWLKETFGGRHFLTTVLNRESP